MRSLSPEPSVLLLQGPFWAPFVLAWAVLRSFFPMAEWGPRVGLTAPILAACGISVPAGASAPLARDESLEMTPGPTEGRAYGLDSAPRVLVPAEGRFRDTSQAHAVVMGASSWERTATAAATWHQVGGQSMVGGTESPVGNNSMAAHMAGAARDWGVPVESVDVEAHSSTEQESFDFRAQAFSLKSRTPVMRLASALNMPRALSTVRASYWHGLPYPCDFRADSAVIRPHVLPVNEGQGDCDEYAHEALCRILYRLRGWA